MTRQLCSFPIAFAVKHTMLESDTVEQFTAAISVPVGPYVAVTRLAGVVGGPKLDPYGNEQEVVTPKPQLLKPQCTLPGL